MNRRAFLVVAAGAAGGAGCAFRRASLPERTFLLEAPPSERSVGGQPAGVLLVRPFRVAPAFDARALIVRRGEAEYVTDAYNAFLLSPGPMLTEAVANWVRGLGVFQTVTTGGSQVTATHALEAEVPELYADYRNPQEPRAVLAFRFRLLHPLSARETHTIWQRDERQVEPIGRANGEELVAGLNRALGQICRRLDSGAFQRPMPTPAATTTAASVIP